MFKRLRKNKKAQNTAEYAILIALVVAAIIAMQTYAQRALQARVRDASVFLANKSAKKGKDKGGFGSTLQYEPYYLRTKYNVTREERSKQRLLRNRVREMSTSNRKRGEGGFQKSIYRKGLFNLLKGGV